MKIAESNILMVAHSTAKQTYKEKEKLTAWVDTNNTQDRGDRLTISQEARSCLSCVEKSHTAMEADTVTEFHAVLKILLVEILSGRDIHLLDVSRIQGDESSAGQLPDEEGGQHREEPERVGWGLEYTQEKSYSDEEQLSFVTSGIIRTEKGEEIEFSLRLNMERAFAAQHSFNLRLGDATLKDPLVLNFNGNGCTLGDTAFSFDLDGDGTLEEVSHLSQGSGFLALDMDGDGAVTTGKELFGPRTGNGFSELKAYDEDGNGWIDENDSVFERLSVWINAPEGVSQLRTLREKGVGAIYLGNVQTTFDLRDGSNQLDGKVRSTGIFLSENGTPGSVQQLDLAV